MPWYAERSQGFFRSAERYLTGNGNMQKAKPELRLGHSPSSTL